jgi:hypothetical protein
MRFEIKAHKCSFCVIEFLVHSIMKPGYAIVIVKEALNT